MKVDFYGKKIVTGLQDGRVIILEKIDQKFQITNELFAHTGPVMKVDISFPKFGSLILTGGFDRKVNLWRETANHSYEKIYEYAFHYNCITALAFSNYSQELIFASGSLDGELVMHQYKKDNFYHHKVDAYEYGINSIHFNKYNNYSLITSGNDNKVKIWKFNIDTTQWENEAIIVDEDSINTCCAYRNAEGNDLSFVVSNDQGEVFYYDKINGNWKRKQLYQNKSMIIQLEWTENGNNLLMIDEEGKHFLFDETSFVL